MGHFGGPDMCFIDLSWSLGSHRESLLAQFGYRFVIMDVELRDGFRIGGICQDNSSPLVRCMYLPKT